MSGWRRRSARAAAAVAALVGTVAVAGVVAVLVLGRWPDADERALVLPAAVAVVVAAVGFGPAHQALTDAVGRLRQRDRRDPEELIASFGERVSRGVPVDELLLQLAEALRRTMALRRAEVWVLDGAQLERVVAVPDAPPVALALPGDEEVALARTGVAGGAWLDRWAPTLAAGRIASRAQRRGNDADNANDTDDVDHADLPVRIAPARHGGALLGALVVERAADAEPFAEADDRALGELGRRLGDLLRNRQLDTALRATLDDLRRTNRELQASRTRLVAAADAERRRIERDLHDGAQQHLVAIAVNLGLARESIADAPDEAAELLDRLAADVRDTVRQVRDLALGIYPPLLAESGLGEALRAAARRSPQAIAVAADGLPRMSAEIETAVYFCCLEALQNIAKHAPGASGEVVVTADDDELRFTVADDGPGFDPAAAQAGSGLQGMADRLGAVGGRLAVDSAVGRGTTVTGTVPRP